MKPLKKIARAIAGAPKAPILFAAPISPRFTRGQVIGINLDGTLSITIDGGASAINADVMDGIRVAVDDTVELHTFGSRLVVDGKLAVAVPPPLVQQPVIAALDFGVPPPAGVPYTPLFGSYVGTTDGSGNLNFPISDWVTYQYGYAIGGLGVDIASAAGQCISQISAASLTSLPLRVNDSAGSALPTTLVRVHVSLLGA